MITVDETENYIGLVSLRSVKTKETWKKPVDRYA